MSNICKQKPFKTMSEKKFINADRKEFSYKFVFVYDLFVCMCILIQ